MTWLKIYIVCACKEIIKLHIRMNCKTSRPLTYLDVLDFTDQSFVSGFEHQCAGPQRNLIKIIITLAWMGVLK